THNFGATKSKEPPGPFGPGGFRYQILAVTYSGMPEGHTTIGAERFHFRVRNGIGWFPLAMAARKTVRGSRSRCLPPAPRASNSVRFVSDACRVHHQWN